MKPFTAERRVEFADTDMGGIVHFSRFFVFMETTEHLFLESLETSVATEIDGEQVGWPRVSASCEYHSPARLGDRLQIELRVERKGRTSMTYAFRFIRGEDLLAEGRMTSVCCVLGDPQGVRPIPIPRAVADRIDEPSG